jgi:hypothetical protein
MHRIGCIPLRVNRKSVQFEGSAIEGDSLDPEQLPIRFLCSDHVPIDWSYNALAVEVSSTIRSREPDLNEA